MDRTADLSCSIRICAFFLLMGPLASPADVVDTGDVLEIGNDLLIGNTAFGQRSYGPGDTDSKENTRLGNSPGVRGELLIGGTFINAGELVVGNQGQGYLMSGPLVSSHKIVVGRNAAAVGEIFVPGVAVGDPHVLESLGPGASVVVGDAGSGSLVVGDLHSRTEARFQSLIIGQQAGSTGVVELGWSFDNKLAIGAADLGGYLAAGVSGSGTLLTGATVRGPGARVEIGANSDGIGEIRVLGGHELVVRGLSATLVVGSAGEGSLMVGDVLAYAGVEDYMGDNAQVYVGKDPGSHGSVYVGYECFFLAGNTLRIGLDEADEPGGTGHILLQGYLTEIHADVIKLGPDGTLESSTESSGAQVYADIVNGGTVKLYDAEIWGTVTNNGLMINNGNYVIGHYRQSAAGMLALRATETLIVEGNTELDGRIEVAFDGTTLAVGDRFTVLSAYGGLSAAPTLSISTSGLPSHLVARPVFDGTALSLEIAVVSCEGDFDRDGDVDAGDLLVFQEDFGHNDCGGTRVCEGDFDLDGDVDAQDFLVFRADYGRTDCLSN